MGKKATGKNSKSLKAGCDKSLTAHRELQKLVADFLGQNHSLYLQASSTFKRTTSFYEFEIVKIAPYCLAAIEKGVGFHEENPISGVKAFSLAAVVMILGLDIEKVEESSTDLLESQGSVFFSWSKKKKTRKCRLYCTHETESGLMRFIQNLSRIYNR